MKRIIKLTSLILMLTLFFSLLVSCAEDEETSEEDNVEVGVNIGERAPTLALELIRGEGKVNPKDYRGKAVVINFWGTWCPPCLAELPDFDRIAAERDDVVIIAIHAVEGMQNAPSYIDEHFPDSKIVFAYDKNMGTYDDMYYSAIGAKTYYPYTVILDKKGVITYTDSGMLSYDTLNNEIDKALAK